MCVGSVRVRGVLCLFSWVMPPHSFWTSFQTLRYKFGAPAGVPTDRENVDQHRSFFVFLQVHNKQKVLVNDVQTHRLSTTPRS